MKWVLLINSGKCIRKILRDLKQEMEHSNGLSTGYARNEAKFIADQILHFRSTYLQSVMTPKVKELDLTFHKIANKVRFEFYVGIYNALRLQCEKEYDIFMNRDIWVVVAEPFCDRTHSQYGIVEKTTNRISYPTKNSKANQTPISPLRVFVSRSNSSNISKIRTLEDLPSDLEVQLIHILLMSPQ